MTDDDLRALVEELHDTPGFEIRDEAASAIERLLAERTRDTARICDLVSEVARLEQERDKFREMAHRVMDADLCLDAVTEARRVLREHFGGNHAFLDDDLIRGVVKMREQIVALEQERDALRAEFNACAGALPGPYYMDPPDGGNVSVPEQLRRMAADAERYRWLRDTQVWPNIIIPRRMGNKWDIAIDAAMKGASDE